MQCGQQLGDFDLHWKIIVLFLKRSQTHAFHFSMFKIQAKKEKEKKKRFFESKHRIEFVPKKQLRPTTIDHRTYFAFSVHLNFASSEQSGNSYKLLSTLFQ